MTTQWYHFHSPRQLRLFGNVIGQEMRDSIKSVYVQVDATMVDEMLRFKNLVTIRLLNDDRRPSQVSTFHNFRDKLKSLRAGLPSLRDVEVQDPRDRAFGRVCKSCYERRVETSHGSEGLHLGVLVGLLDEGTHETALHVFM